MWIDIVDRNCIKLFLKIRVFEKPTHRAIAWSYAPEQAKTTKLIRLQNQNNRHDAVLAVLQPSLWISPQVDPKHRDSLVFGDVGPPLMTCSHRRWRLDRDSLESQWNSKPQFQILRFLVCGRQDTFLSSHTRGSSLNPNLHRRSPTQNMASRSGIVGSPLWWLHPSNVGMFFGPIPSLDGLGFLLVRTPAF